MALYAFCTGIIQLKNYIKMVIKILKCALLLFIAELLSLAQKRF